MPSSCPTSDRCRAATATSAGRPPCICRTDRKSTRLNSSHTEIYTLSLHDALPILTADEVVADAVFVPDVRQMQGGDGYLGWPTALHLSDRSEEHTSELQSHRDLHSFPTRRSSDLDGGRSCRRCRLRARRPTDAGRRRLPRLADRPASVG